MRSRGVLRLFFSELPISSSDDEECRDFSLAIETAHQEVCGNYRKRVTRITARSRRWLDFFLFHFSPKYCKYTITTIINSIDSLHFHPFPTLKSQGTKQGNDKCERGSKQGRGLKRCSDVRSVDGIRALLECRSRFALILCTVCR